MTRVWVVLEVDWDGSSVRAVFDAEDKAEEFALLAHNESVAKKEGVLSDGYEYPVYEQELL